MQLTTIKFWRYLKIIFNDWKHCNYSFLGCINQMSPPSSCCLWMLSNLLLSFLVFFLSSSSLLHPVLPLSAAPLCALQYQSEGSRPHLSKLDLEQWYQELMAGSSQLCPPLLPAKSLSGRRPVLQVEGLSSSSSFSFPLTLLLFVCAVIPLPTHIQGAECMCACMSKE